MLDNIMKKIFTKSDTVESPLEHDRRVIGEYAEKVETLYRQQQLTQAVLFDVLSDLSLAVHKSVVEYGPLQADTHMAARGFIVMSGVRTVNQELFRLLADDTRKYINDHLLHSTTGKYVLNEKVD